MLKLYTTGCPNCKVLESKLKNKHIQYKKISDILTINKKGILSVPVLELDTGECLTYYNAVVWTQKQNV